MKYMHQVVLVWQRTYEKIQEASLRLLGPSSLPSSKTGHGSFQSLIHQFDQSSIFGKWIESRC